MIFWLLFGVLSADPRGNTTEIEQPTKSQIEPATESQSPTPQATPAATEVISPTPDATQSVHPTTEIEVTHTVIQPAIVTEAAEPTGDEDPHHPDLDSHQSDYENVGIGLIIIVMIVFILVAYKWRIARHPARGESEIFDGEAQNMARYRDRLNDDANLTIDVLSDEE